MNALLAQLDRRLARRGETIYLRRTVGTANQSYVQCELQAFVRAFTIEQLVGAISAAKVLSDHVADAHHRAQWPGGKRRPAKGGIIEPSDLRIPNTNDVVFVRGAQKAVQRVAPVFDRGECIRH